MYWRYRIWGYNNVNKSACFIGKSRISKDIQAGAYSSIAPNAWIGPKVSLGKYVLIAPNVTITGDDHRIDLAGTPVIFSGRPSVRSTVIEDDVWVGQNVSIRAGVVIGRGAVIGMGAVVVKDVPAYSVVAGVPAREIGHRFSAKEDIGVHDEMLEGAPVYGEYCGNKE
jgi:acetyltransferase-like isoleucine patch superfamily enzyme